MYYILCQIGYEARIIGGLPASGITASGITCICFLFSRSLTNNGNEII